MLLIGARRTTHDSANIIAHGSVFIDLIDINAAARPVLAQKIKVVFFEGVAIRMPNDRVPRRTDKFASHRSGLGGGEPQFRGLANRSASAAPNGSTEKRFAYPPGGGVAQLFRKNRIRETLILL